MLKIYMEYSFAIVVSELIISLLACCVSYRKHKSIIRLIPVFLASFGICSFAFLIILPIPVKIVYPDNYTYDFMSQFAGFDIKSLTTYLSDRLVSHGRFATTPFICSLFGTVLFIRLRKPLIFILSLLGTQAAYALINIAINTLSRYTMTRINPADMLFIAIGYTVGWILSILILKALPSIDNRLKLTEKQEK